MTRNARALLLALALLSPFLALQPHATATVPLTRDEARNVICFEGAAWPCEAMLGIATRESGLDPLAVNRDCRGDGSYTLTCWGLLQVLSPCECGLLDAQENAYRAHLLYLGGGVSTHWRATQ